MKRMLSLLLVIAAILLGLAWCVGNSFGHAAIVIGVADGAW